MNPPVDSNEEEPTPPVLSSRTTVKLIFSFHLGARPSTSRNVIITVDTPCWLFIARKQDDSRLSRSPRVVAISEPIIVARSRHLLAIEISRIIVRRSFYLFFFLFKIRFRFGSIRVDIYRLARTLRNTFLFVASKQPFFRNNEYNKSIL